MHKSYYFFILLKIKDKECKIANLIMIIGISYISIYVEIN